MGLNLRIPLGRVRHINAVEKEGDINMFGLLCSAAIVLIVLGGLFGSLGDSGGFD
jgi:hypothetical protein